MVNAAAPASAAAAAAAVQLVLLVFAQQGPDPSQTVWSNNSSPITSPCHNLYRRSKPTCNFSFPFLKCNFSNTVSLFCGFQVPWELFLCRWQCFHCFFLSGCYPIWALSFMCLCFSNRYSVAVAWVRRLWFSLQTRLSLSLCSTLVRGGLIVILPSSSSATGLVCYLCNQAEDVRRQARGRLPNITGICHIDTSAVRICQAALDWPCCTYAVVH